MEMNELLQNNTFEIVNGIWFSFDHFVRENYVTNGIYKIIGKQSNEKTRKREREREKKASLFKKKILQVIYFYLISNPFCMLEMENLLA